MDFEALASFILEAKARCYVGGGTLLSLRPGSHDIGHSHGEWFYLDSYFGGTDFAGQEVVWLAGQPVWAMNYFGRITDPARIDASRAGAVIKAALSRLYAEEGRFLGGTDFRHDFGRYIDRSSGDTLSFSGREVILVDDVEAYDLDYRGGLIKA
ncbi:MAG: DUF5680 domain-containing protein [Shinella sp.]|nr:DUF5680 domain-containing protein [Shinella sp.]